MKPFLDALRRILLAAGRALAAAWVASLKWLSVPVNLCLAVVGLVFLVSFSAWAIVERFEQTVIFFPDGRGMLRGELRDVPRSRGPEARAEIVAAELLLGPKDTSLSPVFAPGVRVESVLYRKSRLFVDISSDAARTEPSDLSDPNSMKKRVQTGIAAMDRSLRAALPGLKRLSLTIGGKEPYAIGLKVEGGKGIKKTGK